MKYSASLATTSLSERVTGAALAVGQDAGVVSCEERVQYLRADVLKYLSRRKGSRH